MDLSIVIPVYNEENRITATLLKIKEFLSQSMERWPKSEVVVVSDGSSDNTDAVVQDLMREFACLKLISYRDNRGKGFAVKSGIAASRGRIVLFSDADGATPITELNKLADLIISNKADIVIASRRLPETQISVKQPVYRVFIGHIFSRLTRILLRMPFLDTQCGFKVFKGDIGRKLFAQCETEGFAFDVEIIHRALQSGYRIIEQGVIWNDDPDSRVSPFTDGMKMLRCIINLKRQTRKKIFWYGTTRTMEE